MRIGPSLAITRGGLPRWLEAAHADAAMAVYFDRDKAWDGNAAVLISNFLSCTRSTTGSYIDSDGLLTSVPVNTLRYGDHGVLSEETRINIGLQSETLDHATWTKTGTTISADAVAAPDGATTADKWRETAGGAAHHTQQGITLVASTQYSFSCFAKQAENKYCGLYAATANQGTFFDLDAGTVGNSIGGAPDSSGIEALGSTGWYRCWMVFTQPSSGAATHQIYSSKDGTNWDYSGTLDEGYYLWGVQVEAGNSPTSYIATTSSSVTRDGDVLSFSDVTWYAAEAAGTVYLDHTRLTVPDAVQGHFITFSDATANETISLYNAGADATLRAFVRAGGVTQVLMDIGETTGQTTHQTALAWDTDDVAASIDGATAVTDTSATLPPGTDVGIGRGISTVLQPNAHIKRLVYWDTRKPNATLESLTT